MARIDINQKITSRLPIVPEKLDDGTYKYKGLCPVVLQSVELLEQTDEKGEFEGITRKVLAITFTNYRKKNSIEPERFTTLSEKAVGTTSEVEGVHTLRAEVDILGNNNDMFKRIAHILDNCVASPNYRDFRSLSEADQDKYFDLPGLPNAKLDKATDTAARLAKYDAFLTFFANWFNGDGKKLKPIHLKDDGTPIIKGWLKLLPNFSKGKYNKTFYTLPTWVSTGFFEASNVNPQTEEMNRALILSIKASESLELAKPNTGGGTNLAGMPDAPAVGAPMMEFLKAQMQGQG